MAPVLTRLSSGGGFGFSKITVASSAAAVTTRSLRFNSSDSAYLSRTPGSAGNRKTWTWSGWVKRTNLGYQIIFVGRSGSEYNYLSFDTNDELAFRSYLGGWQLDLMTTAKFRDPSAWYHILVNVNTTAATSSDRASIYVNGTKVTTFSTATYPSQNTDLVINAAYEHNLGRFPVANDYGNFMLANIHFIDGYAYDPSYFGETNATTGVWDPKTYTGSYGSQGWFLNFADNSSTTSGSNTGIGKDTSGNGNYWNSSGLSVTAGSGNDSLIDFITNGSQTDTGLGGEVVGNYATFNALALNGNTLSNGNLNYLAGSANKPTLTTIGIPNTGKWYVEFTDVDSTSGSFIAGVGIASVSVSSFLGLDANGWSYQTHSSNAGYHNNGVFTTTGRINGAGSNTIVGIAIDRDAQKIWFSVNGTFVNSGAPASGTNAQYSNLPTSGELFPGASTGSSQNIVYNAGQRAFAYTAPSGFKALCTANLPTPTIAKGSDYFDVKLYTGNGSTQTISGLNFSPDWVWTKSRSVGNSHAIWDTVRGVEKRLIPNDTVLEATRAGGLTAFTSDGFTHGNDATGNDSSTTYAAWCWDAGSSTVSNTQGSITSQVRANASAGFSVVGWSSSQSTPHTVGHGLGVAPAMIIVKSRGLTSNWHVGHTSLGWTKTLYLQLTNAADTHPAYWNDTAPTSTIFSIGNTGQLGGNNIAYCFAPVSGYSSFGSYTGNGSADGPFVFTGFRPRWIMFKRTNDTSNWTIVDTQRDTYNLVVNKLFADTSTQENVSNPAGVDATNNRLDILSNGFKHRDGNTWTNGLGSTYIYAAFAESPINYSRAR